jgi:uncharacterized protein with NRDE domain
MCLIAFAWQRHPQYRLILAGNRDELHRRPSQDMHWWHDAPSVLAGRDLQAGGTWLAVSRNGRFAAVTNYRETISARPAPRSRGELVSAFVNGDETPSGYCARLQGERYAGFSLLVADRQSLYCTSNRGDATQALGAGVYGLSNAALDTPWPKLLRCRSGLERLLAEDAVNPTALFALLADTHPAPVDDIRDDDLPFAMARAVSAPFIRTETYGTRCTTVLLIDYDGRALVCERRFDSAGKNIGDSEFRFDIDLDNTD